MATLVSTATLPARRAAAPPRFRTGDVLKVPASFLHFHYEHFGIAVVDEQGREWAVHYDTQMDGPANLASAHRRIRASAVRVTGLERFAGRADVAAIRVDRRPAEAAAVAGRALRAVGTEPWAEGTYHPFRHNCEHFTQWCLGESRYSPQVDRLRRVRPLQYRLACTLIAGVLRAGAMRRHAARR